MLQTQYRYTQKSFGVSRLHDGNWVRPEGRNHTKCWLRQHLHGTQQLFNEVMYSVVINLSRLLYSLPMLELYAVSAASREPEQRQTSTMGGDQWVSFTHKYWFISWQIKMNLLLNILLLSDRTLGTGLVVGSIFSVLWKQTWTLVIYLLQICD